MVVNMTKCKYEEWAKEQQIGARIMINSSLFLAVCFVNFLVGAAVALSLSTIGGSIIYVFLLSMGIVAIAYNAEMGDIL
jgi:hypothetical protein